MLEEFRSEKGGPKSPDSSIKTNRGPFDDTGECKIVQIPLDASSVKTKYRLVRHQGGSGVQKGDEDVTSSKRIPKLDGPWSPEEDAELIKWTAKLPGGVSDRWMRVADEVGTRTEEQVRFDQFCF